MAVFMAAFKHVQARRKFLVLDGPSRMGKTEFVRSLVEPVATLELNCASCLGPPFSDFRPSVHRLVLLDEGSWRWCSKTGNCSSARIRRYSSPHRQPIATPTLCTSMIACWWSVAIVGQPSLRMKTTMGAKWIQANQVYVHVAEPLWIRPEAGVSASVASSSQGKV